MVNEFNWGEVRLDNALYNIVKNAKSLRPLFSSVENTRDLLELGSIPRELKDIVNELRNLRERMRDFEANNLQ